MSCADTVLPSLPGQFTLFGNRDFQIKKSLPLRELDWRLASSFLASTQDEVSSLYQEPLGWTKLTKISDTCS